MDPNAALTRLRDAARFGQGGISIDTFTDLDEWLTRGGFLPEPWAGRTVAWVSDDSEECTMCTFPESSRVYLRIGDMFLCQEHIWRGLVAVLGPHPRHAAGPCTCTSVAVTADQSETIGPCAKHGRP